jgi:hypothetical protein
MYSATNGSISQRERVRVREKSEKRGILCSATKLTNQQM